jgi:PAS domain S-box-containing protein
VVPATRTIASVQAATQPELMPTLERISVPSYVIDREGAVRWVNQAARRLLGDVVGRDFTDSVAPTHRPNARKQFARKLHGTPVTDFEAELLDSEGRLVRAHVSSVPLQDGHRVVAVFGLLQPQGIRTPTEGVASLTPRQLEVLGLLGAGASTHQIQSALHISRETVRNHVRMVLRALGAHSRLEAVVVARRRGVLT